jgi:putative protein-disulfide isomerase
MVRNAYLAYAILLTLASACTGQQQQRSMKNQVNAPLLCAPETGACELPAAAGSQQATKPLASSMPDTLRVVYFTDPICSSCWGIEPQLRKLKLEYGSSFTLEYRMGGLLPDWSYNSSGISKPSDVAHHWDEVSQHYQMPIDGDVWLEDPLSSSFPPSIAFKAAQLQDEEKAIPFLRRIREMVFLEKKNITRWQYLEQAAAEAGLNTVLLKQDVEGRAKQAFQDDLALARRLGVRGFPTLIFSDGGTQQHMLYGFRSYEALESMIIGLQPTAAKAHFPQEFAFLFRKYPTLTTKEYAMLRSISFESAQEELSRYYSQKQLTQTATKNGPLWKRVD